MAETGIDFDNPWKASLEKYFEAFMAFFFPRFMPMLIRDEATSFWIRSWVVLLSDDREKNL